jgi:hypothetical protein
LTLRTPATVAQRATFDLDGHRYLACSVTVTEHQAGPLVLSCPLSPEPLRRLHDGPLRLRVLTTVRTDTGSTTKLPRLIELRRWPTHPSSS